MIVTHTIPMHLDRMEKHPVSVDMVRGDSGRKLELVLYMQQEPWLIPEDATASVHYLLPDGHSGMYEELDDGAPACQSAYNTLTAVLPPKLTEQCGVVQCTVRLERQGVTVHTFLLALMIQPDAQAMDQESERAHFLPCPAQSAPGQIVEVVAVNEDGIVTQTAATDRLAVVEQKLEDLMYEPIAITSFTNDVNTAEMGSTVNSVKLSWAFNKQPVTLTLDGMVIENPGAGLVSGNALTASKTWILAATDERGATATKTTTLSFLNGVYYGAGMDPLEEGLVELTKALTNSRKRTFTVNATAGEYIWYALPVRLGQCTFKVGGFEGGFDLVATEDFTNPSGYTEQYYIYRSAKDNLGQTTVEVS